MKQRYSAFSLIELSIVILIIGILVAGVTQSSRLVREFRLSSARNASLGPPVATIPSLTMWLDATKTNAFATGTSTFVDVEEPEDGTAVGRWNDVNPVSTARNSVSQASATLQPLYKTTGINNLPAVQFDGTNDCFAIPSVTLNGGLIGTNALTIFVVQKMTGTPGSNTSVMSWEATSQTNRFILFTLGQEAFSSIQEIILLAEYLTLCQHLFITMLDCLALNVMAQLLKF